VHGNAVGAFSTSQEVSVRGRKRDIRPEGRVDVSPERVPFPEPGNGLYVVVVSRVYRDPLAMSTKGPPGNVPARFSGARTSMAYRPGR
jgi:hypothetical protein